MPTTESQPKAAGQYHVVIDSIGSANPSASKMLADVLGTPVELVVKALYNTPTVLFSNIEKPLADQCHELLQTLGMVSRIQRNDEPLPESGERVDVGVYINDIMYVSQIAKTLSEFLGCDLQESFNLLMNDPSVVMGGVSHTTAQALCDRLKETEVIISNPKKDLYTLIIRKEDSNEMMLHKLMTHIKHVGIEVDLKEADRITNLTYEAAQDIWKKYHSTGLLKIVNQSFQRFEINLKEVDKSNVKYRDGLMELVGMPDGIIDEILSHLPIQLESSANGKHVADKLAEYKTYGLICSAHLIQPNNYKLIIESNPDLPQSKEILSQYLQEDELPKNTERWEFPHPLGDLLFRYIELELVSIGCEIDYHYFI